MKDWAFVQYDRVQSLVFKLPVVKVDRNRFLRNQLKKELGKEELERAINESPTTVLTKGQIKKIGDKLILKHSLLTALLTALLTLPNNILLTCIAIVLDILQAQMMIYIITQKLLYLYGHKDLKNGDTILKKQISVILWIISAVMIGRGGLRKTAKSVASKVTRTIIARVSARVGTRVTMVNLIRQVMKWAGVTLTQKMISAAIDIIVLSVCSLIAGIFSFWIFYPMANNLNRKLQEVGLAQMKDEMKQELGEEVL